MTHKKLPSILALSISLELIISPLPAFAQTKTQNILNSASDVMNFGMGAYNTFRGNQPQGQPQMPNDMAIDIANFQKQQVPVADKYFTQQNMTKIPGLAEYIAKKNLDASKSGGKMIDFRSLECQTLPATLTVGDNAVCRDGRVNDLAGDPKNQADEAFVYYNQYKNIGTQYTNYQTTSNVEGQAFGTACMNNTMSILKGFFAYRVEQMDLMQAEFEAAMANFEAGSEMDLKSIRESTALLNGENSAFATEFKNTDVLDYGKRFADPACGSIFSKDGNDGASAIGKNIGLLGIQEKLKSDYSATPNGSKYSPEQFISKNADIVKDIQKMAADVGEQAKLNFSQISSSQSGYSDFLKSVPSSVSSETGATSALNSSFFADLQIKFSKTRNTLADQNQVIQSELGPRGSQAFSLLNNIENDSTFEAEVATMENGIKGDCVNKSGVDTAVGRIYDPTLSKQANKQSSELVKKKIMTIISDTTMSSEKKLAELKLIEGQNANRYLMRMDSDYDTSELNAEGKVVRKTVNASSRVSPESYFSDIIKNCESQFQVNKLKNKLSGKEAINQLRALKQAYKKVANQHSKEIKDEIIKKMIDCNGNGAVASSATVASCTPEKLNMSNPGFCAKAALSCSTNMKQCTEKAEKFVNDIKGDRLKRTNNFNNNVESTRKQMVGMFDATLTKYVKEAESLRGMFGAAFAAPKDIQRDLKRDESFDQKFLANGPDSLEVKDPKKYLEMIKGNIEKLKTQVQAQQESIISPEGPLATHIKETNKNLAKVSTDSAALAAKCLATANSYAEYQKAKSDDYNKKTGESNAARDKFCRKYGMVSNSPNPVCGDVSELSDAALSAVNSPDAIQAAADLQTVCNSSNNESSEVNPIYAEVECKKEPTDPRISVACLRRVTLTKCFEKPKALQNDTLESVAGDCAEFVPGKDEGTLNASKVKLLAEAARATLDETIQKTLSSKSSKGTLTDAQRTTLNDMKQNGSPAFCNANNNSGPYNTKSNLPFQNPATLGEQGPNAGTQY